MLCAIVGIIPTLSSLSAKTTINRTSTEMTAQLQATNILVTDNSYASCMYLIDSISAWVAGLTPCESRSLVSTDTNAFLLSLSLTPDYCQVYFNINGDEKQNQTKTQPDGNSHVLRDVCYFVESGIESVEGVVAADAATIDKDLDEETRAFLFNHCPTWNLTGALTSPEDIASVTDLRAGAISVVESSKVVGDYTVYDSSGAVVERTNVTFSVTAVFNETYAIESS